MYRSKVFSFPLEKDRAVLWGGGVWYFYTLGRGCSKVAEMELSTTANICLSAGLAVAFLLQFTQMKVEYGKENVVSS